MLLIFKKSEYISNLEIGKPGFFILEYCSYFRKRNKCIKVYPTNKNILINEIKFNKDKFF